MIRLLKPLFAFLVINLAVILGISLIFVIISVFTGIDLSQILWNYSNLLIYSFIVGFLWALISLFTSKWMVKFLYNITIIDENTYQQLKYSDDPISRKIAFLYEKLKNLAQKYGVDNVELGIYESPEPNAFATGCWICGRLIAFSSGILQIMDEHELEWVLWHEFAHLMNWDMVTTSILQWFLNTFVIFISRVLAWIFTSKWEEEEESSNFMYPIIAMFLEFFFGLLVSMVLAWYSRIREYAADRDSALKYSSKIDMIDALKKLKWVVESDQIIPDPNNDYVATLKIYNFAWKLLNLFATHPPLDDRIKKLEQL